ncbi:MAG: sensor domain-containing diguanylate cyclase [Desulfovibrio sp.]|nr:sensor domain-containing diguanylate cyclase [Desulfovibrio sp.]
MPVDASLAPYSLIPLSSDEALWEWDIVTDAFFLSQGAVKSLNLTERPVNMPDFYGLMPPEAAVEVASAREGIISGKTGSLMECAYVCNGLWVEEHALVMTRNSEGRATRLLGQLVISSTLNHPGFKGGQELISDAGLWLYDVAAGLVWRDRACEKILGQKERRYPLSIAEVWLEVHPAERDGLSRHYDLFCNGEFLGDTITDIVRIRLANGGYMACLTRATCMRRGSDGKAQVICGLLTPGEPQLATIHNVNNEDRLVHALNSMGGGQWNWDTSQDAIYFCPRYLSMLGYGPEDDASFAKHWRSYVHPDDLDKVEKARQAVINSPDHGDNYECTYRMRRADGGWAWIFDRGCVTWRDADGHAGHMIGSITNITTAQAERDKLEELVRHDTLTGLRSRAFCNLEIEHIEQNQIRPVSVISVDITGLKMVNDYLGHARGDELLTKAASLMRSCLRRSDCVGRIGGDEFIIILAGCDHETGAKVLDKLKSAFREYNDEKPSLPVFAAIGLASADTMEETLTQVMGRADDEMYRDKKEQRRAAHACLKAIIRENTGQEPGADERIEDA